MGASDRKRAMTNDFKTVFITGASSGLGRGLAKWFAARPGTTVYAAARRTAALESLRAEAGEAIVPVTLDVSKGDETHARVTALDAEVNGFDLVIANAGLAPHTWAQQLDWAVVKNVIDVNVTGSLATLSAVIPGMIARGRGHLVGVSSLASLIASPRMSTYCASKSFLSMWLESVRLDVEPLGLDVTCLMPGFVKSEITAKNRPGTLPFLLETEDAVVRMAKAIVRRDKRFAFPWQMRATIAASSLLPRSSVVKIFEKRF